MSGDTTAITDEQGPSPAGMTAATPGRRLQRITQGQQLAGVCNGIATYAELRVDWVRTCFVLASLATAGIASLVYVALAVILPVDHSRDAEPSPEAH